jgi:hypothetical protein
VSEISIKSSRRVLRRRCCIHCSTSAGFQSKHNSRQTSLVAMVRAFAMRMWPVVLLLIPLSSFAHPRQALIQTGPSTLGLSINIPSVANGAASLPMGRSFLTPIGAFWVVIMRGGCVISGALCHHGLCAAPKVGRIRQVTQSSGGNALSARSSSSVSCPVPASRADVSDMLTTPYIAAAR